MAQILNFPINIKENDYLPDILFNKLEKYIKDKKKQWDIRYILGCIFNLEEESILSFEQAAKLYDIVDPHDIYNNLEDYLEQVNDNPFMKYIQELEVL